MAIVGVPVQLTCFAIQLVMTGNTFEGLKGS